MSMDFEGFRIGMYQVTNLDYELFIRSRGYEDSQFWSTNEAKMWAAQDESFVQKLSRTIEDEIRFHYETEILAGRVTADDLKSIAARLACRQEPLFWRNPRLNQLNQPVVGVNFWECEAFCNWLTHYLSEQNLLPDGQVIRLPTEFEWEYAARRGSGMPFPWGQESPMDPLRAHVRDNQNAGLARTCAVGLFPFARWPDGPLDMTGNVWEWTSSSVTRYDSAEATLEDKAMRITRGGSWLTQEPEAIEVTFRTFDPPFNAYEDLGMRVVVASPH